MATYAPPIPQVTATRAEREPSGWTSWITTTDHKRIGIMYMVTTFVFFCLGGVEALMMRLQLGAPNNTLVTPAVYNQLSLGSCTANAIGAAIEFDRLKQGLPDFVPSRLFIYYNERVIEGTVRSDSGAMLRDGIKSVASQGVCPEPEWPYDISKFAEKPPAKAYRDAENRVSCAMPDAPIRMLRGPLSSIMIPATGSSQ